ncbi:MAG: PKD domain-containing protein, partial [Bacteroidales bacterium]|nr:PKD domain-containing protein [Bacteroidales bacterium]
TPASSTSQNPSNIIYNTPGVYNVTLVATNAFGSDTELKTGYITVNAAGTEPVANFTANQTTINAGSSVNFTDLSTNTPTSWVWIFEGGTPASSTSQNPSNIIYNTPGVYNVTLVATNAFGSDTELKTGYIIVTLSGNAPVVDFTATNTNISVGSTINFTDLSTNSPTEWIWDFEGGTPSFSNDANPANIQYNLEGTYYVSLIANNTFGSGFLKKDLYITVFPSTNISEYNTENSLHIYPNPASNELFVDIENLTDGHCTVTLFNTVGQKIKVKKLEVLENSQNTIRWNISTIAKGVYLIKLETEKTQITKKVIIY